MPLVRSVWWHQPKNVSAPPGKVGKIRATMFTMLTLPRSERLRLAWAGLNTQQRKLLTIVWKHAGAGGDGLEKALLNSTAGVTHIR